jgi:hypothetical protein
MSSGVTFFSKELPNSAVDGVVKPTDRAVRKEGSIIPTHKTDDDFISSPLKAFPANAHPFPSMLHGK